MSQSVGWRAVFGVCLVVLLLTGWKGLTSPYTSRDALVRGGMSVHRWTPPSTSKGRLQKDAYYYKIAFDVSPSDLRESQKQYFEFEVKDVLEVLVESKAGDPGGGRIRRLRSPRFQLVGPDIAVLDVPWKFEYQLVDPSRDGYNVTDVQFGLVVRCLMPNAPEGSELVSFRSAAISSPSWWWLTYQIVLGVAVLLSLLKA